MSLRQRRGRPGNSGARSVRALALALAGLLLGLAAEATPLQNPGFEDGTLAPWFLGIGTLDQPHDQYWSATNVTANTGAWSAFNIGNHALRQDFAPVSTSSIAELSLFVRKEGDIGLISAIQLHYLDGSFSQVQFDVSQFDLWERHDFTADVESGKALIGLSVFGVRATTPTRTYVDDFVLRVPEAGPGWLALAAVLAGLPRRLGRRA